MLQCGIALTGINPGAVAQAHNSHVIFGDFAVPAAVNITGLVVYASSERSDSVRGVLEGMAGVEVHAVTPEGRMVVTVERSDDAAATEALDAIARVDGVLSTALVYHHDETLNDESNR